MAKISIVVPVYNVQEYLQQCLDSITNQTLKDIEVICVNDGSTDNCKKILDNHAKKDNRFKVIHKGNSGYGNTINIGIENATSDYVGIVESDDFIAETMYEELYNCALKTNSHVIRAGHKRVYQDDRKEMYIAPYPILYSLEEEIKCVLNNECTTQELMSFFGVKCTWVGIYSIKFLEKYNIRHNETEGASFQDTGFLFKVFMYASNVSFIKDELYYYRIDNPNSSMKSKSKLNAINNEYNFMQPILDEIAVRRSDIKEYFYREWLLESMYQVLRVSEELVEEMTEVIKEFIKHNKEQFIKNDGKLLDREKQFITYLFKDEEALLDKIKSFKANKIVFLNVLKETFKNKDIYIYGATQTALTIINLLDELHLSYKVKGFVVTELPSTTIAIKHREIPVITYEELIGKEDITIIVAAQKLNSEAQICKNLEAIGIDNYIKHRDILEQMTINGLLNQFKL